MSKDCSSNKCECDCNNISPNKMCQRTKNAFKFDVEEIKTLTSDPQYICKCCGRTANDKENLCSPTSL